MNSWNLNSQRSDKKIKKNIPPQDFITRSLIQTSDRPKWCLTILPELNWTSQLNFCLLNPTEQNQTHKKHIKKPRACTLDEKTNNFKLIRWEPRSNYQNNFKSLRLQTVFLSEIISTKGSYILLSWIDFGFVFKLYFGDET